MDALDAFEALDVLEVPFADASEALAALEALSDVLAAALDDVLAELDDAGAFDAAQPVSPATRSIDTATADRTRAILFMLPTFRFQDGRIGHSAAWLPFIEHYSLSSVRILFGRRRLSAVRHRRLSRPEHDAELNSYYEFGAPKA